MIEFVKSAAVFLGAMALGAVLVIAIAAFVAARDEDDAANGEGE